jgi:hypothetical protein
MGDWEECAPATAGSPAAAGPMFSGDPSQAPSPAAASQPANADAPLILTYSGSQCQLPLTYRGLEVC